jgi:hypothetical protein
MLEHALAESFAAIALANVGTPYPFKLDQVIGSGADVLPPRALHPAFHGSYDWHSCVHMHWTLARLLRLHPDHAHARTTRRRFDARLTPAGVGGELATLAGPHRASFERPYGWGWLLKLAAELHALAADRPEAKRWRDALTPLASEFGDRFVAWLPRVDHPTRAGAHGNTAFALLFALDYAEAIQHRALVRLIGERSNRWYGRDRRYPADYEPSGDDFLSAGLVEAALMQRVVDGCSFTEWWTQFEPARSAIGHWLTPVTVSDARDSKIVHLHGLNLSRAWCWRRLLPDIAPEQRTVVERAIEAHLTASLPAATGGDYVGTHWLVSFALLALGEFES